MKEVKLSREHKNFLQNVLQTNMLKSFSENMEWYNFNRSVYVNRLKNVGEYWSFDINEKLEVIIRQGKYYESDKEILNSVRMYCINKDRVV